MVNLFDLLGNKSIVRLLDFFISNSDEEFSQVKIKEKTELSKATLTKWLAKFEEEGLVKVRKEGVSKLYKLEKNDIIIKYLKIINNLIKLKEIKNLIGNYKIKVYLYGSAARGEDNKESDIDLLIIGKIRKEDIIDKINKISERINKQIRIEIFTSLEWVNLSKKDKAFYERVEKDKIEL